MSNRLRFIVPAVLVAATACLPDVALETDAQKASYGIGRNIGTSLADVQEHLDMVALMMGVTDALSEMEPALTDEEIEAAMTAFNEMVQEAARDRGATEGAAYLEENAAREGVMITESGLQYEVLREGDGESPVSGQTVTIHYRGSLPDGSEFDSSHSRGAPTTLGVDNFVSGFAEALKLMKVGGQMRVVIPSDLAYGPDGRAPLIGPNQVLVFEIELLGVE